MSFLNALAAYPAAAGIQYIVTTGGSKAPTLGLGSTSWPPSSWTSLQNLSVDDGFVPVSLPFNFYFNNGPANTVYVASNLYITFGSGSSVFSGLSSTNPALDKIFLSGADRSFQRVAYINAPDSSYTRIRIEGASGTSGTPGASTVIYELTFFRPSNTGNRPTIELLVGNSDATGGVTGMYTAGGVSLGNFNTFNSLTSYVMRQADSASDNFVTTLGYISNSGY
jgi:hypothetical protein